MAGINGYISDPVEHIQVIYPLLLDIALLETRSTFDKAKTPTECYDSNVCDNLRVVKSNDTRISGTVSTFFGFVHQLLWCIAFPLGVHKELNLLLDRSSMNLREVIGSNKGIAQHL